jgi:hypothetical protein
MASLITGIFSIVVIRQQRVHAVRRFRLLTDGLINESAQPMMLHSDEELWYSQNLRQGVGTSSTVGGVSSGIQQLPQEADATEYDVYTV